jgi:hypothetical protein
VQFRVSFPSKKWQYIAVVSSITQDKRRSRVLYIVNTWYESEISSPEAALGGKQMKYQIQLFVALPAMMLASFLVTGSARAQEIWFAPPAAPAGSPLHRAADLMDLFKTDAPWQEAASHVKVFELYGSYVSGAPQEEINTIVADLNRRHIPIALEVGVMNVGPKSTNPPCGGLGQVEGYGIPRLAMANSEKIKKAGGVIRFIAMDEPLWFGHYFKGRPGGQPGCQSSIEQILDLIKDPLRVYEEEFPGIVIGDTEPTDIAEQSRWKDDLSAWVTGFRNQTGHPLAFMHLDIPFNRPGEEGFAVEFFRYAERLKQQNLLSAIGVIYDGTPTDTSDESWIQDAKGHIHLIEEKNGLRPDQVLIQSWQAYPQHVLPESSPGSLTGLVNYYAGRAK